jgi:hypothetical protein
VIRRYLDGTRLPQLQDQRFDGLQYHEGIDVLAALAPDLATAISGGQGRRHLNLDGTVIRTDRLTCRRPNCSDLGTAQPKRSCPALFDTTRHLGNPTLNQQVRGSSP